MGEVKEGLAQSARPSNSYEHKESDCIDIKSILDIKFDYTFETIEDNAYSFLCKLVDLMEAYEAEGATDSKEYRLSRRMCDAIDAMNIVAYDWHFGEGASMKGSEA